MDDFGTIAVVEPHPCSGRKDDERQLSPCHRYHRQSGNVPFGNNFGAGNANQDFFIELAGRDDGSRVSDVKGVDADARWIWADMVSWNVVRNGGDILGFKRRRIRVNRKRDSSRELHQLFGISIPRDRDSTRRFVRNSGFPEKPFCKVDGCVHKYTLVFRYIERIG